MAIKKRKNVRVEIHHDASKEILTDVRRNRDAYREAE